MKKNTAELIKESFIDNNKNIKVYTEAFSELINDFTTKSIQARELSRKKYSIDAKKYNIDVIANLLDGLILSVSKNFHKPPVEVTEKVSYQIGICASYIRTHFIINTLIENGDILEASTLIRKQLESITRLLELRTDKSITKLSGRTPNVNQIFNKRLQDVYQFLSDISHSGKKDIYNLISIEDVDNGIAKANIYPMYSNDSLQCYKFHCYIAIIFLEVYIQLAYDLYNYNHELDYITYTILMVMYDTNSFLSNKEDISRDILDQKVTPAVFYFLYSV